MTTSSRAVSACAPRRKAATCSYSETSTRAADTEAPNSLASCRTDSSWTSEMKTRSPASANASAMARPMPDPAPVIATVRMPPLHLGTGSSVTEIGRSASRHTGLPTKRGLSGGERERGQRQVRPLAVLGVGLQPIAERPALPGRIEAHAVAAADGELDIL